MNLTLWLNNKFKGLNLELLAVELDMPYEELAGILNGTGIPTFTFVVKIMHYFNMDSNDQLELFYYVGERLGIGANSVFKGVVDELLAMNDEKHTLNRK
ncbi:MAG: helix-turn-helix transcriptional regulator [Bacilli bacterium]|nr:helix-turn-helix transcriptional regulator [Bacilli bacterium]